MTQNDTAALAALKQVIQTARQNRLGIWNITDSALFLTCQAYLNIIKRDGKMTDEIEAMVILTEEIMAKIKGED